MTPEQTETAAGAALAASEAEVTPEVPEIATDPTGGETRPDAEALQARLRELEEERDRLAAEKAERDRTDAVAAVVSRHRYVTEEIVQALPGDLSVERLEAVADALNKAIPAAVNRAWNERSSDGMGKGGLDPTRHQGASWDRLFRNTL